MFSSLSGDPKQNIYVDEDYTLTVAGSNGVECMHAKVSYVHHAPSLRENLLLVAQLTHIKKTIEFWSYRFIIKDLMLGVETIASGYLDPKDGLYKFCDSPMNVSHTTRPAALIAQTDDRSRIWHE